MANNGNTITAKFENIRVYSTNDEIRYRVKFDQSFDAIVKTDGQYVEGQADYIDFKPAVLIAQCISCIEGLDLLYTKKKEQGLRTGNGSGFGAAELGVVLRGATIKLERTKFDEGEEYADADGVIHQHDHAGYNTSITDITISEKMQAKLDKLIDEVLGL